jgi:hypothetical protein
LTREEDDMARITIEKLARPEEEELSAGQAGQVVGAGYYLSPFGPVYGGGMVPGATYNFGGVNPAVYNPLTPYTGALTPMGYSGPRIPSVTVWPW